MAGKKIKLEEKAISEILAADTNLESGVEASNVEDWFEEEEGEEEEEEEDDDEPQQKSNHRLQQLADYEPIVNLLSVQQNV
jgi:hypothetical protein